MQTQCDLHLIGTPGILRVFQDMCYLLTTQKSGTLQSTVWSASEMSLLGCRGERGKKAVCRSALTGEGGVSWGGWCWRRKGVGGGCSAAVDRSERRLRSMLRGEIRLLPQLWGTVRQLLILDGLAHEGEYSIWLVSYVSEICWLTGIMHH